MGSRILFLAFLSLMLCLPAGAYAAGDLEGDLTIPADVMAQWDKDWAAFRDDMAAKQKDAKAKLAALKKQWDEAQKEPAGDAKKAKLRKLAKEYWGVKIAYYKEKLRRLKALKAKYGAYPELAQKLDDDIKAADEDLKEAEEKLKKELEKIDCGLEILGIPSDCPD